MRKRLYLFKFYVLKVKCSAHLGPRMEISYPHKCGGILKNQLSWFSWAIKDAVTFLLKQKDFLFPLVSRESFSLTVDDVTSTIISNYMWWDTKPIKKRGIENVQASFKKNHQLCYLKKLNWNGTSAIVQSYHPIKRWIHTNYLPLGKRLLCRENNPTL